MTGSLQNASSDRLACLFRHWVWADEAKKRFEFEISDGWADDEELLADHPFGAYYHWCALLCGLGEAALENGLLSAARLGPAGADLEGALPRLRACRQFLIAIPSSLEEQPRFVDLIRDETALDQLRRVHDTIGNALRDERIARDVASLDPEAS